MGQRGRSLQFKLTLWYTLVFAVVQALLIGGIVFLRREVILRDLDKTLGEAAKTMVDSLVIADLPWDQMDLGSFVPANAGFLLCAVRFDDGKAAATWNIDDPSDLTLSDWEAVPSGPVGEVVTVIAPTRAARLTGSEARLRMITVPFRLNNEIHYFQAAVRDQALDRLLGPFFDLVVIGIPVGILAALLAGSLIARRAVSPVLRLSLAARDVSPSNFNTRISLSTSDEEIARLQGELNSALARLEAAYKAQEQFISNVSHELKTPIAVLLTEAQVIKLESANVRTMGAFVDQVEREMQRLGRLVESFLTLTRADLDISTTRETVHANDLILQSVQRCRTLAEQARVSIVPTFAGQGEELTGEEDDAAEFEQPTEPLVRGDSGLLQSMVDNLLHNAIRHAPAGTRVSVDLRCRPTELEIAVSDRGPGIAPELLDNIFDRFVRGPDEESLGRGSGIGLFIVRSIAQLHGGSIRVANNPEGGCTFAVTLPLGGEPTDDVPSTTEPAGSVAG